MPEVGDTFLVPSGPAEFKHLFVVCTGSMERPDFRLVVSVTSIHAGIRYDPACVILPGEHSFVRHPSYVAYRKAERRSAADMDRFLAAGYFVRKDPVSQVLLDRILRGFLTSDFAEPWAVAMLRSHR